MIKKRESKNLKTSQETPENEKNPMTTTYKHLFSVLSEQVESIDFRLFVENNMGRNL